MIENNTRRIKILEEMAQNLYREWFVNFRFPGHEQTKLVDSGTDLGQIPEGWEVKPLGDVIDFKNGKAQRTDDKGEFPLFGSNGIIGKSSIAKYSHGIIIGRVGAYCGSLAYCKSGFWASDNTIVAIARGEQLCFELAYQILKDLNLRRFAGGSAQPLLTQIVVREILIVVPSIEINKKFENISQNIWDMMINLENKNFNLSSTRDLLLPKLISGEIDVESLDLDKEAIAA